MAQQTINLLPEIFPLTWFIASLPPLAGCSALGTFNIQHSTSNIQWRDDRYVVLDVER
jgi:hypothetical protein